LLLLPLPLQSGPPDVWLQLRQLLVQGSRDGACLRPLLDEQQQANARQQQQLQEAQDTIAQLQAELAGIKQQQQQPQQYANQA
jgi:hypothetical protein